MRRRTPFHPSHRRLREWLDSGEPSRVTQHIETCDRCADQLEQLEDERIAASTDVTDEPETRSKLGRNDVELFGELFTVGVEAANLMTPPPTTPPNSPGAAADTNDSPPPPPQEPS